MSTKLRVNRKASDSDIIRLNAVGLSLSSIGKLLGCHPSSITQRLSAMGVPPADTRRAFMDQIYYSLTPAQQLWLQGQLGPHIAIKDYVRSLLVKAYLDHQPNGELRAA
jgi:hypothetical protein